MEKFQEDALNMYQATADVLAVNAAVYAGNIPFEQAVVELNENVLSIQELRDQQEEDITGVAEDKQLKRQTLENLAFQAGSIITFYASSTGNRPLVEKVNFTRTELVRSRDNELPGMASQIHDEAVTNAVAVLPYGLTAAMTAALSTALGDYVRSISKPRTAKGGTMSATERLPQLFAATTTLLEERIDRGMELYISNADFYAQYFNARVIVNSPTLKRALEVHIVDSLSNLPIAHVNVTIDTTIRRRSTENGNIREQNLAEGPHQIHASLPGYTAVLQNFNVISGQTTKLTLAMAKE